MQHRLGGDQPKIDNQYRNRILSLFECSWGDIRSMGKGKEVCFISIVPYTDLLYICFMIYIRGVCVKVTVHNVRIGPVSIVPK